MRSTRDITLPCLVGLAAAAAAAAGPAPAAGDIPSPPMVLMQVGERYVTSRELEREIEIVLRPYLVRRRRMMEGGAWTDADEARLAAQVDGLRRQLELALRNRAVMEEYARNTGYRPNEVVLEQRLRKLAEEAGGVEALVRREGRTLPEIRSRLREEDLQGQFMREFAPLAAPPSPRDIREYFAAHRAEIRAPAKVKVRVIFIPKGDDPAAAAAEADAIRRNVQYAPDRFEGLAREKSRHPETAGRGGLVTATVDGEETEWIRLDALLRQQPVVARAAGALGPGEVSDVLPFADGYVLVKLDGLREGEPMCLEDAAEVIRRKLAREHREALLADWVALYRESTYVADGLGRRLGAEGVGAP